MIKMLGASESPLRDVACSNINRANRRGAAVGCVDRQMRHGFEGTPDSLKVGTSARSAEA